MKKILLLALCGFAAASQIQAAVISDWTFETTQPGVVTLPAAPGAGVAFSSFAPEIGVGSATGLHAGNSTYSSPAGNGSARSFSANVWGVGDYFQFQVNLSSLPGATGFSGITLSFDQVSSATGPKNFNLQYSADGGAFTTFSSYSPLTNANATAWTAGTPVAGGLTTITADLSAVGAINSAVSSIAFRLVDNSTTAENGSAVATAGTDRVDNFIIAGTVVPEPSSLALLGMGVGAAGLFIFRRRK